MTKEVDLLMEALLVEILAGEAKPTKIVTASKRMWDQHKQILKKYDDLLYTWQYELRWAASRLNQGGVLTITKQGRNSLWELTPINSEKALDFYNDVLLNGYREYSKGFKDPSIPGSGG